MDSEKRDYSTDGEEVTASVVIRTDLHSSIADNEAARRRLLVKLDVVICILLALAYLLAYMDRNNIGYARLMLFQKDLNLSDQQFYNSTMIFFAGYLVTVFPSNFIIRKIGPNFHLGGAVTFFGLCVTCMCAARGYADVMGLRFGIGAAEAMLQSSAIYMSLWYRRNELGKRIAVFYSAATLSGVFSGLIAYGVQKDLTIPGRRPAWEWLFLMEGVIAIGVGLLIMLFLPKFPDKAKKSWLLSEEDLQVARQGFQESNQVGAKTFQLWQVKASLLDPKTYFFAFVAAANATILASAGAFLPTIVKSFGFTAVSAQLFTVIPYACAFVSMIVIVILSDRYRNKGFFILGSLASCAAGLVILLATTSKQAGILGACLLVLGAYPAAVLQIAWVQINFCGYTKRATSWAVAMLFGQGFSMLGSQIYTTPPRFVKGHATLLGLVVWGMAMTVCAQLLMHSQNRRRERELERCGGVHPDAERSFEETCDDHVKFRYIL